MNVLLVVVAGVLGLLVGSFLNVVVWRLPRGESVVSPPSACPACGHRVRGRDNVPVLSWLVLRGRCRDCGAPIAVRYPLVELLTGLLFAATAWRFGWAAELAPFLYLAAVGVALAFIDLDTHRLPDRIVLPSYAVVGGLLVGVSAIDGDWAAVLRLGIGGAALWVFYFALAVLKPGGMGFGDVKLAGLLGGALGWLGYGSLLVGAFAAFLLGGAFAVVLLVTGQAKKGTGIPFGPWMIAGAAVGIAVGEQLARAYLSLLGV